MAQRSYYDVLGVSASAELLEIEKAFRKRVAKVHPDQGGTKEAFQEVINAFKILSDPEKRRVYDMGHSVTSLMFETSAGLHLMKRLLPSAPVEPIRGEDLYLPVRVSALQLEQGGEIAIQIEGQSRTVNIPPHADERPFCRIPQAGKPGRNGALSGDLFLIVFSNRNEGELT